MSPKQIRAEAQKNSTDQQARRAFNKDSAVAREDANVLKADPKLAARLSGAAGVVSL